MKNFYTFILSTFSILGFSQTILNQSETASRSVQDPNVVILAPGFNAKSSISNPFYAKIGESTDTPANPTNSDAGSGNPSGTVGSNSFHDTQGNIEVNGGGQLQYTLPVALPPGVKSVAPQINLVYTSGAGNGIAGYGWSISGITSISRMGRTIEKDGEVRGIKLDYSDYYSFNGQRLILKSGEYGKDGAEYVTEKYSNVKIKSVGTITGQSWQGPLYWEVTFEDGSQAWYGATPEGGYLSARTPLEYNIVKWKDAQGNYINYSYTQANNVAVISTIQWGGNETLGKPHFNSIELNYTGRDFQESSYVNGIQFLQQRILTNIVVYANESQFKRYDIAYKKLDTNYQFIDRITEYNANNESANPVIFNNPSNVVGSPDVVSIPNTDPFENVKLTGDFNGDSYLDFIYNNGLVKLGALDNENFTNISTNKYFNYTSVVVSSLIDSDGSIFNGNGVIQVEDNKLVGYVLKNNQFQKVFEKEIFSSLCSDSNYANCSYGITLKEGDINGDGITDAFITAKAYIQEYYPCDEPGGSQLKNIPPGYCVRTVESNIGNFIVDLKNTNNPLSIYFNDALIADTSADKYIDIDGDGKIEVLNIANDKWTVYEFVKNGTNQYLKKIKFSANLADYRDNEFPILYGDYNGDGKLDFAIPTANKSSNWRFYIGTGNGFTNHVKNDFLFYRNPIKDSSNGYVWNINQYFYSVSDLNRDGKSDISCTYSYNQIIQGGLYRQYGFQVNYRTVNNVLPNGNIDFYSNLEYKSQNWYISDIENFKLFIPVTNTIKTGNNNIYNIFLYRESQQYRIKAPTSIAELARIQSVTQASLTTSVEYKELIPSNSNFYSAPTKQVYPYVSFQRMDNTFSVSKLTAGDGKKQDYKYKDFTVHLAGKGVSGFRQTARSSWYVDGKENTVVWSGSEIDPLNEGLPIKEWSVKTYNDANLIFPADISENNIQLLSYKKTDYQTNTLANGVKVIVPWRTKTRDFLKDITTDSEITYGDYYLPAQTNTSINSGFATFQTTLTYIHNPSGVGKDYYIGRPESKIESATAYSDTKSTEEYYEYDSNLLSYLRKSPTSSTGSISEGYLYDGWGNVVEKTTAYRNPKALLNQTEKAQYDDKGRFVLKKTDNLGLETNITYNQYDWGKVITQTDPMGVVITNTYDSWGKLLTSKTNLAGTTTYQYSKLANAVSVITQNDPDGNISQKYTNKLGQEFKTRTKAFGQNNYVAKYKTYDGLGRILQESEPYFDSAGGTESPGSGAKWSTITYDDTVFPTKATATSFNGKQMETSVSGRTTSVKELNGNLRTNTKTTDALGNVITATDKGGTITFSYNAAGQQTKAQYDTNIVTTKYDIWGRKIEFNDPSNGIYTYSYDGFGRVLKETSPKGYKQYTYNSLGQLATQKELSNDGTSTNKTITYTYNAKGLITGKSGTANGKAYSSTVSYDSFGRVTGSSENSNGKYYIKKGITYDDKMRVTAYEKSLYSSGQYTKVVVENVYDPWSGDLYQVKDTTQNKVLWQLQSAEADGRVISAKLGGTTITNTYDNANFIASTTQNKSSDNATFLKMSYTFDAVKNELTYRKREGGLGIVEYFDYDDNNRLKNWTDPVTGIKPQNIKNTYDVKGRITNNDQVGQIKFDNTQKIYQPTGATLNAAGQQNYTNNLIQKINYNENNDPIFIDGQKGDARFEYGLTEMRQMMTYGGNFDNTGTGKYSKYYSEDGSYEIIRNNQTRQEKHLLYIGGTPYESDIVYLKDFTESSGYYKFLHKDYLGSILAITDEVGNAIEQRHYDAWGNFTHLKIGTGAVITDALTISNYQLIIDRCYTSHEHLPEVGLIHMNGRLYDPLLRRFLNADENIQDMFNTQNYNKYGYVLNNPLMYADPSGEFIWFVVGAVIGAYITGASANGTLNPFKWDWKATWGKIALGAVFGAVSGGVGAMAGSSAAVFAASSWGIQGGVLGGAIAGLAGGAVGGAISGLGNAVIFGESIGRSIVRGFVSGAIGGAIIGGAVGGIQQGIANGKPNAIKGNIWSGTKVAPGRSAWALNNTAKPTTVGKIPKIEVGMPQGELIKNPPSDLYDRNPNLARELQMDSNGNWKYPLNDGAIPGTESNILLKEGTYIDRFGNPTGRYASPIGESYGARSLPPGSYSENYGVYRIQQDIIVNRSIIAPSFGQPGYGIQYKFSTSLQKLLEDQILLEISFGKLK